MTTYLLTEAQRQTLLDCVWRGNSTGRKMHEELQSLPMVQQGEPTRFTDDDYADIFSGMMLITSAKSATEFSQYLHKFQKSLDAVMNKVNAPQALTPLTADDVTDEMVLAVMSKRLHNEREIIAAAYNAVIKHRGEAK